MNQSIHAARKADVDRPLQHVGIHAECRRLRLGEADEFGAVEVGFAARAALGIEALSQELEVS